MIEIKENILLGEHSTFRVGGPAKFFAVVTEPEELQEAVAFCQSAKLPHFILGGGSNILFDDAGFGGLVLHMALGGISADENVITAGAGVSWDALVGWTIARGFCGLENLSGIPGTVGGAVVGNIGAYGREIHDTLASVEIFDGTILRRLSPAACRFSYRSSIFKMPAGKSYVVTRAAFRLRRDAKPFIEYPDLIRHFGAKETLPSIITPQAVRKAVLEIRAAKLPDIRELGTAGSFFKNPVVGAAAFANLKKRFPDLPSYPVPEAAEKVKIPAGWLLDKVCGFKGKRWGPVGTYQNQALVLVNYGDATAAEVKAAATEMAAAVKAATGVILEREVEYV